MNKQLNELEQQYNETPIPKELDAVVEQALKKKPKKRRAPQWMLGGTVAASILLTAGVNVSPAMAKNLAQIPGLETLVEVLTFTEYEVVDETYEANIEVPHITGDSQEIAALNERFAAEGEALFEDFKETVEQVEGGHLGVDSGYVVKTDTDKLLSLGRYVVDTVASSSTVMEYTTVDKELQTVITLPSLFKDEQYVEVITAYVQEEMLTRIEATNGDDVYWVKGSPYVEEWMEDIFTTIQPEQSFYITTAGKLVISFDKYEVAPGYMGLVEFEIPTEVIADQLVSDYYIH